jgi:hypothetical protein
MPAKRIQEAQRRAFERQPPALHRRLWIWLVYLLLFGLSVPWYLPADEAPSLWLGLPDWVVISLLAVLAIAGFTAWVLQRHWPLDEEAADR